MEFWKSLPNYKQPTCKSYSKISDAIIDLFTEAKITFFSFICSIVEPYLKKYQREKPMVPFMYGDLKSIAKQLAEINLDEKGNLLPINKVELGFGAHYSLSRLNEGDIITIDKTKKIQEGGTVFCRKHIEENL